MGEEEKKELRKKSGMGAAALTLGLISLFTNLFWYICIPTGILGIIFGAVSAKKSGTKMGKAGLITGIIGICLCALVYISLTILIVLSNM